jgi:hypothetical protein
LRKPDAELSRLLLGHVGGEDQARRMLLSDNLGSGVLAGASKGALKSLYNLSKSGIEMQLNAKPLQSGVPTVAGIPLASGNSTAPGKVAAVAGGTVLGTAEALARNPKVNGKSVRQKTAEDIATLPEAIIGGLGQIAYDTGAGTLKGDPLRGVKNAGKGMGKDYAERYGPLVRGDYKGFEKGIEARGSATPELLDITGVAAVGGATAGRALGGLARAGKLGSKLEQVATAPRPVLRVTGGVTREQDVSKNLFRVAGQRVEDARRTRAHDRYAKKATERGMGVEGLVPNKGEVVALRKPLPGPAGGAAAGAAVGTAIAPGVGTLVGGVGGGLFGAFTDRFINNQRRLGNKEQGRISSEATSRMDAGKKLITRTVREAKNKLSKPEQVAMPFAIQGLLPVLKDGGYDVARSVKVLESYRQQVVIERDAAEAEAKRVEEAGGKKAGSATVGVAKSAIKKLRDRVDVLQAVDRILADPEAHLTPNLAGVSQGVMDKLGPIDASINEGTAFRRKARPQAEVALEPLRAAAYPMRDVAKTLKPLAVDTLDTNAWVKSMDAIDRAERKGRISATAADSARGKLYDSALPERTVRAEKPSELLRRARDLRGSAKPLPRDKAVEIRAEIDRLRREKPVKTDNAKAHAEAVKVVGRTRDAVKALQAKVNFALSRDSAGRLASAEAGLAAALEARAVATKDLPVALGEHGDAIARVRHAERVLDEVVGEVKQAKAGAANFDRVSNPSDRLAMARADLTKAREVEVAQRRVAFAAQNAYSSAVREARSARLELKRATTESNLAAAQAEHSAARLAENDLRPFKGETTAKARDARVRALEHDLMENEQKYYQQFADDVAKQAEAYGLPVNPVYFRHQKLSVERSGVYTTGAAIRYFDDLARSNMVLLKLGLYDMTPAAFERGLMATLKRASLLRAITENLETLTLKKVNDKAVPTDLNLSELQHWMASEGLSIDGYYFINPKKALRDDVLGGGDSPFFVDPTELVKGKTSKFVEGVGPDVQSMLRMSPDAVTDTKGWYAIPLDAGGSALEKDAKGSSAFGRFYDRGIRGLGSGLILATSPGWLMVQRIVDAYGLTAASKFNPVKMARTLAVYPFVWHSLTPQMQEAIQARIGAGYHRRAPKMGKAATDIAGRSLASQWLRTTWDDLAKSRVGRAGAEVPGVLFALDNWFTSHAKQMRYVSKAEEMAAKQRYEALRESVGASHAALDRVMQILKKPDAKQIEDLLKDSRVFDEAAAHIHRAFGDWNNLSGAERHGAARVPMFYTWLRFAGRTLFHTLPVRHPVLLAVLLELAKAHKDAMDDYYREQGALLPGESLPSFAYSKVIREDGKTTDLGRISPVTALPLDLAQSFISVLTGTEIGRGPKALLTSLPPTITAGLEAALGEQLLTGAKLHIGSDPQQNYPFKVGGVPTFGKTYAARLLGSNPIFAALLIMLSGGKPVSDDSLPGAITELKYKTTQGQSGAEAKLSAKGSPTDRALQRTFLPLKGMPDTIPTMLAVRRSKSGKKGATGTLSQSELLKRLNTSGPAAQTKSLSQDEILRRLSASK